MAAQTWLRATALYTDLFSEPVRISSKLKIGGEVAALRWCWGRSFIDFVFACDSHAEGASDGRTRIETRTLSSLLLFAAVRRKFSSTSPDMSVGSTVSQSTRTSSGSTLLTSISLRSSRSGSSSPCRGVPGVLGLNGSRFVGVPGAGGAAGAGGFIFTVVRVRASEERAALNLLADASGLSGVEEREVSDEPEIERRLENIEVGFKRRFGACVSLEAMAACQLSPPSPSCTGIRGQSRSPSSTVRIFSTATRPRDRIYFASFDEDSMRSKGRPHPMPTTAAVHNI